MGSPIRFWEGTFSITPNFLKRFSAWAGEDRERESHNQKLAAIKSLVTYANQIGKRHYTLSQIKSEKLTTYRDPKGIPSEQVKLMLDAVNTETIKGLRDLAILLLLWGNALLRL